MQESQSDFNQLHGLRSELFSTDLIKREKFFFKKGKTTTTLHLLKTVTTGPNSLILNFKIRN